MAKFRPPALRPVATLDAETLKKIHSEAEMLRTRYGVEVRALAVGEKPDIPHPAEEPSVHSTFQP